MSHFDRLRTLRYVSPSGKEFIADFEDLSRSGGKKTAIHELPQQDRAYVQDLGNTATKYPIRLYFSGSDYDQTADAFALALGERGPGTLLHPRWGDMAVLPLTFLQVEQFVDGVSQAVFDVDFVDAPEMATLSSSTLPASAIAASTESLAAELSSGINEYAPSAADIVSLKDRAKAVLKSARDNLIQAVGSIQSVSQQLSAEIASIEGSIDTILGLPAELAAAVMRILMIPARATVSIHNKIAALSQVAADVVGIDPIHILQGSVTEDQILEALQVNRPGSVSESAFLAHFATQIVISVCAASAAGAFPSRLEAVEANVQIDGIRGFSRVFTEVLEGQIEDEHAESVMLMESTTANAVAIIVAETAEYVLETSFSLRIEQRVTLTGDASPLELAYRFYGDIERIDDLVVQNGWTGDLIFLVPAGSEVTFYEQ